jgi:uncharacterized repeat protein (TIGR01451 family)
VFRFQPPSRRACLSAGCAGWLVSSSLLLSAQPIGAQSDQATTKITNQAQYNYEASQDGPTTGSQPETTLVQSSTGPITNNYNGLIDPLGVITGCDGKPLSSYDGYSVALYSAAADGLNPAGTSPLSLVRTEVPDILGNGIPLGLLPNRNNANPFFMDSTSTGAYNFLFDRVSGQLDVGKSYILVVKPPAGSTFGERRVRLDITSFENNILGYKATSLDGQSLSLTTNKTTISDSVNVNDASVVGLSLLSLQGVGVSACDAQPIQIVKSADRATAEPGDSVVYRLTLRNTSDTDIIDPTITDTLPLGLFLRPASVQAQLGNTIVPVTITQNGSTTIFKVGAPGFTIPAKQVVNLVYAVTLDADAVRGTGRNTASITGIRKDNNRSVSDGPVGYQLTVRQGLIRDTGTLIGRVFVDKNFDGEQQPNEPGIPNAVIFLDDGNRITTDVNGLFSVQAVAAGYRTGVLDLNSLPGYTLAPNVRFNERNSQSRLVKIAPGGLVRMNFGVTPTAREAK